MKAMTAKEFVTYWCEPDENGRSQISYSEEALMEHSTQYESECALFGDAGPGQGTVVSKLRAAIAQVNRQLARIKEMK